MGSSPCCTFLNRKNKCKRKLDLHTYRLVPGPPGLRWTVETVGHSAYLFLKIFTEPEFYNRHREGCGPGSGKSWRQLAFLGRLLCARFVPTLFECIHV